MIKLQSAIFLLAILGPNLACADNKPIACALGPVLEYRNLSYRDERRGRFSAHISGVSTPQGREQGGFVTFGYGLYAQGNNAWPNEYLEADVVNKRSLLQLAFTIDVPVAISSITGNCDIEGAPSLEIIVCSHPVRCPDLRPGQY